MVTPIELHAEPDDFFLTTSPQQGLSAELYTLFVTAYLTDVAGNRLTDPAGNPLVVRYTEEGYAVLLHAVADDFHLNAE